MYDQIISKLRLLENKILPYHPIFLKICRNKKKSRQMSENLQKRMTFLLIPSQRYQHFGHILLNSKSLLMTGFFSNHLFFATGLILVPGPKEKNTYEEINLGRV